MPKTNLYEDYLAKSLSWILITEFIRLCIMSQNSLSVAVKCLSNLFSLLKLPHRDLLGIFHHFN